MRIESDQKILEILTVSQSAVEKSGWESLKSIGPDVEAIPVRSRTGRSGRNKLQTLEFRKLSNTSII